MICTSDSEILQKTSRELAIEKYLKSIRPRIVPLWEFRQRPGLGYGRLSRSLRIQYWNNLQLIFERTFLTGLYSHPDDMLKVIKDFLVKFVKKNISLLAKNVIFIVQHYSFMKFYKF